MSKALSWVAGGRGRGRDVYSMCSQGDLKSLKGTDRLSQF